MMKPYNEAMLSHFDEVMTKIKQIHEDKNDNELAEELKRISFVFDLMGDLFYLESISLKGKTNEQN